MKVLDLLGTNVLGLPLDTAEDTIRIHRGVKLSKYRF